MIFNHTIPRKILQRLLLLLGKRDLVRVPPYLIFANFVFQRIFGLNRKIPISVHYTSRIQGFEYMELGKNVAYNFAVSGAANIVVAKDTKLVIGDDTIFAQNVCIRTCNHDLIDRTKYNLASVHIGKNVWLGHGVVVLPGVTIGDNVTVGANSVVAKDIEANTVAVGMPAKVIKHLDV